MVSRRGALTRCAASLALFAGCLSDQSSPQSAQPSPTPDTSRRVRTRSLGDAVSLPGGSVTLRGVDARRLIAPLDGSGVHAHVVGPESSQFVVASVTTAGAVDVGAVRAALHLGLDGDTYRPAEYAFPPTGGGFTVAFEVPAPRDADTGSLVWTDGDDPAVTWPLSDETLSELAAPPQFVVRSFDVPETSSAGSDVSVGLAVGNDGGRRGRFLADVGTTLRSDLDTVRFDVPAEATVTRDVPVRVPAGATGSVTVVLDWGRRRVTRTVGVGATTDA